jgi:hypothetical protein
MAEQWHVGRTVGVTVYQDDSPAGMVAVCVGEHAAACATAQRIVAAVNAQASTVEVERLRLELATVRCELAKREEDYARIRVFNAEFGMNSVRHLKKIQELEAALALARGPAGA